jgi:hypothetical protein
MSAVRKAIHAHRVAMQRYLVASRYSCGLVPGSEGYDAADEASTEASKAEAEAWSALSITHPESLDDLAAYVIHIGQAVREFDHETESTSTTAEALEAISSACLSLAGQERLR